MCARKRQKLSKGAEKKSGLSDARQISMRGFERSLVRNFGIISHVDHGKTTLSNRLLEETGTLDRDRKGYHAQYLDKLAVERERGITVKAQTVSMFYGDYALNLNDSPGHIDFQYEVSRTLRACQGAVLLVDASQGVQAQTLANFYQAFDANLDVVPVISKIDLPTADVERAKAEMYEAFDIDPDEVLLVSAKTGEGVPELIDAIIERVSPPPDPLLDDDAGGGDEFDAYCRSVNDGDDYSDSDSDSDDGSVAVAAHTRRRRFKALLFDNWFDNYFGVVCLVAVNDGSVQAGDTVTSLHSGKEYRVQEVGIMHPEPMRVDRLQCGHVGYLLTGMKETSEANIGDTLASPERIGAGLQPVPGFQETSPKVFAGIYPCDAAQLDELAEAINRMRLNDASIRAERETSLALGGGYRCGFLGLLHMDVFLQRMRDEYSLDLLTTAPTVRYRVRTRRGPGDKQQDVQRQGAVVVDEEASDESSRVLLIDNPEDFPAPADIVECEEPWVRATIITPREYLGKLMQLCHDRRGDKVDTSPMDATRVMLIYRLPLNEIVVDFFDALKKLTSGYATFEYMPDGYEPADIVKLTLMLNQVPVEPLAMLVEQSKATPAARRLALRLKENLSQQLFVVAIQVAIGTKVIARETLKALRKQVGLKTQGGGDYSRKQKLLEKQKAGKQRSRAFGKVQISPETFHRVLSQQ
jgi:small GTP-binding protein